eukprot:5058795-Amphidinium_carterae.1
MPNGRKTWQWRGCQHEKPCAACPALHCRGPRATPTPSQHHRGLLALCSAQQPLRWLELVCGAANHNYKKPSPTNFGGHCCRMAGTVMIHCGLFPISPAHVYCSATTPLASLGWHKRSVSGQLLATC